MKDKIFWLSAMWSVVQFSMPFHLTLNLFPRYTRKTTLYYFSKFGNIVGLKVLYQNACDRYFPTLHSSRDISKQPLGHPFWPLFPPLRLVFSLLNIIVLHHNIIYYMQGNLKHWDFRNKCHLHHFHKQHTTKENLYIDG